MVLEIVFNVCLLLFSVYAFLYVGSTSPAATDTELGAAFWPRIILGLLVFLLVINIWNVYKKSKDKGDKPALDKEALTGFFKSKIFIGMIMVIIMAFVMEYLGFILTCCLFIMAYGFLLGQKSILKLILTGVIATIILYVIFQGALDIMLPRGYGFLRNFALFVEGLLPF